MHCERYSTEDTRVLENEFIADILILSILCSNRSEDIYRKIIIVR